MPGTVGLMRRTDDGVAPTDRCYSRQPGVGCVVPLMMAARRVGGSTPLGSGRVARWLRMLMPVAALALLSACATGPGIHQGGDPQFTATMPRQPRPPEDNNGAIYQARFSHGLFEDYKARDVGDLLTVMLVESTKAKKSAESSTSKDSDMDLSIPGLGGTVATLTGRPLAVETSNDRSFDGQGDASQSNALKGSIAVTVAQVLPNGNLVVQGEKWIRINRGQEYLRLRGIVRPVDITASNTVLSTQIANAQIAYGGTGAVASSSKPGWLTRFFNSPIWPF